jgi:hypothetical protein
MKNYPAVFAFGYAVTPKRRDYRVSIEGMAVNKEDITESLKAAFLVFCKDADELRTDEGLLGRWE